jgi:hypothetical protein
MRNTADVTGGKPIAVLVQPISGVSAINPLVAFYDIHGEKRCYSFILSRTPHEASFIILVIISLLMSPLLGYRPSLWNTHKENGP